MAIASLAAALAVLAVALWLLRPTESGGRGSAATAAERESQEGTSDEDAGRPRPDGELTPISTSRFAADKEPEAWAAGVIIEEGGSPIAGLTLKAVPVGPPASEWLDRIMSSGPLQYVTASGRDGTFRLRSPVRAGLPFHLAVRRKDDRWFVAEAVLAGIQDLVVTLPSVPPPPTPRAASDSPPRPAASERSGSSPRPAASPEESRKAFETAGVRAVGERLPGSASSASAPPPDSNARKVHPEPAWPTPLAAHDRQGAESFVLWELAPAGPKPPPPGRSLVYRTSSMQVAPGAGTGR